MQNIVYRKVIVFLFLHSSVCVCSFVHVLNVCQLVLRECSPRPNLFWWLPFLKSSFHRFKAIHSFKNVLPDLKVRLGRQVRHVTNTSALCCTSKTISKQKPFKRQNKLKKVFNRFLSKINVNCKFAIFLFCMMTEMFLH